MDVHGLNPYSTFSRGWAKTPMIKLRRVKSQKVRKSTKFRDKKLSESQKVNKVTYQKINNLIILIFLQRPLNDLRPILRNQAYVLFVLLQIMKTGMIMKYFKKQ